MIKNIRLVLILLGLLVFITAKLVFAQVNPGMIKVKNQAYIHYMLLSNAVQQIISANKVEDTLQFKQP